MASVALESGVLRYVSETGALLERDGMPVTAPAALPVPECQALTDQLEQLEAQVRDAQARVAGGDHSSGATTELRRGGPVPPKAAHRSGMAGILVLAIGLVLLAFAGGWGENTGADQVKMLTGIAATTRASSTTRRALTCATAGALGLLGALLGTAVAYLAAIAWYRSSLGTTVRHVPVEDLIVILLGLCRPLSEAGCSPGASRRPSPGNHSNEAEARGRAIRLPAQSRVK